MLKIENRGCQGNGSEKLKKICTFVHLSTEVKNGQNFKKIYFFYFQLILTLSDNDSVLCASVYMCFVVTCWERADLLALVCGVFCEFVTFPLVSWVRCGT